MSPHLRVRAIRKRRGIAIALLAALTLGRTMALAAPGSGDDDAVTTGAATSSPGAPDPSGAAKSAAAAPAPAAPVLAELEELKNAVQAQTKLFAAHSEELESERTALREELARIADLETKLGVTPAASASGAPADSPAPDATVSFNSQPPAASSSSTANVQTVASTDQTVGGLPAQRQNIQNQGNIDRRLSDLEARLKKVGPLSFSGDFRFREEPFYGGPTDQSLDQNRQRYRLRFNTDVDLGYGVTGGFSTASGDVNNPISTNQDVTAFYTRKPLELDKAFIQYTPTFFKDFTIVAGKFAYPWFNTELTWDKDLNPEGMAQTFAVNLNSVPVLKRVALVGFELPFAQVSGVSLGNKSLVQSVTYGAQLQSTWQLAPWAIFSAYEGFYDFHNADPIAFALAKANAKNPVTPLSGALPLVAGSTTQNSITTTTANGIVTVGGTGIPTGVATVTNAQFASKFALVDTIARLDLKTPAARWPVTFIGNFVQNTQACANVGNILAAPANTATAKYTQSTNFACNPDQRTGYWGEVEVGRILEKHDLQFGYTRIFIEREAVLSNFDYSEIRQGSAVSEHRASVFYTVNHNVIFDFIALIGRPINSNKPAAPEPWLTRLQFDVNYAF